MSDSAAALGPFNTPTAIDTRANGALICLMDKESSFSRLEDGMRANGPMECVMAMVSLNIRLDPTMREAGVKIDVMDLVS